MKSRAERGRAGHARLASRSRRRGERIRNEFPRGARAGLSGGAYGITTSATFDRALSFGARAWSSAVTA
jgi:hypothetical protein